MITPWRNDGTITRGPAAKLALLGVLLAACHGAPAVPPGEVTLPRGDWVFVKGGGDVRCSGSEDDSYEVSPFMDHVQVEDSDYGEDDAPKTLLLTSDRFEDQGCGTTEFAFADGKNALGQVGKCGRVTILENQLQLVSPSVLYWRRYIEVNNTYWEADRPMDDSYQGVEHLQICRAFVTGYLIPYQEWLENSSYD